MPQLPQRRSTGEAIASARRARGWTQQQLADLCGYSQSTISRLERGRQSASDIDVLALVAERLALDPAAVGLAGAPVQTDRVNRRTFLGTTVAAASLSLQAVPAAAASRRLLNPAVVAHLRNLRSTLVQSDSLYGPNCVIGAVHDHLNVIEHQLLPAASGALRRELLETAAEWAEFAGWLHEDMGQADTCLWWSDRAMEWAQEADDPLRQSYILMRKAQSAVGLMQQQRALGLATAALRIRGGIPAGVLASAHLQQAHAHALAGDADHAARALDTARETVEGVSTVLDASLGGYCVPSYVDVQRGACLLLMGKSSEAVAAYQQALTDWPSSYQRERGLHLARLASAYAADRTPDAACATALDALAITQETASRRTTAELQRVVTGLAPWRRMPAVRELTEAVAAL